MIYHVSKKGNNTFKGTQEEPFLTISKAAQVAMAGDTVVVHEGVYREWIDPIHSGLSDFERITFTAAENEKVVIKGSEIINDWTNVEGNIWKVTLDNSFFGDFNPYKEKLWGDWLLYPELDARPVHAGDVYLNGISFFEARSMDDLKSTEKRIEGIPVPWGITKEYINDPEQTLFKWFSESEETKTIIYANFNGVNPNEECTEINVRKYCFYPTRNFVNYITVSGFELCQAASTWAPPTGEQPGLIGPNWSKGWIIENNIIHDAKCSGISLGKPASIGDSQSTLANKKSGYQYQLEIVFRALEYGWCKEKIGSHIIRNNKIYDCGQNGIVGHMGSAFCEICDNEIYNIATKYEFYGHEIGGIKLHAAIDTHIHHNKIHKCSLGTWLDWQTQGTRISRNLYYNNCRDFFIEVTHGPCVVDNNIFGSDYSFDNVAQGTAYINNTVFGGMRKIDTIDRSTPYHLANSTKIMGFAFMHGGDDRLYNNIFISNENIPTNLISGTSIYNPHHKNYENYLEEIESYGNKQDHVRYFKVPQPCYINNNAYLQGATVYDKEDNYHQENSPLNYKFIEEDSCVYLEIELSKEFIEFKNKILNSKELGSTRISECSFTDENGKEIIFDIDINGEKRDEFSIVGAISNLKDGKNKVKIWG